MRPADLLLYRAPYGAMKGKSEFAANFGGAIAALDGLRLSGNPNSSREEER
jgi:hypothetical protein